MLNGHLVLDGPLMRNDQCRKVHIQSEDLLAFGGLPGQACGIAIGPWNECNLGSWRSFHLWRYSLRFSSVPIRTGFMPR
jgi:hypothetical protein